MLRLNQVQRLSNVRYGADSLKSCSAFSTMKDLLESFDKKPATNNANNRKGTVVTNQGKLNQGTNGEVKKKKDVLKFSQVMSGSSKFTINEASTPSAASNPIVGVSLRDSFRRVEQQNKSMKDSKMTGEAGRSTGPVRVHEGSKAKLADEISRDIMQNVTANTLGKYSGAIPEIEEKDVTSGDLRFKQLQQKMHHKKKKLDEKYPTAGVPSDSSTPASSSLTSAAPSSTPNHNHHNQFQHSTNNFNSRPSYSNNNSNNNAGQHNPAFNTQHNNHNTHHNHSTNNNNRSQFNSNNNHSRPAQPPTRPNSPQGAPQWNRPASSSTYQGKPAPSAASTSNQTHSPMQRAPESYHNNNNNSNGPPQILDIKDHIKEYKRLLERKGASPNFSARASSSWKQSASREKVPVVAKGANTIIKEVIIPSDGLLLRELSSKLSMKLSDVKAKLVEVGEFDGGDNDEGKRIDADVAELIVLELGFAPKRVNEKMKAMAQSVKMSDLMPSLKNGGDNEVNVVKRAPTVCVMGHVDHGKTTLLDGLRKAKEQGKVAGKEAGGITQKLSAFTVNVRDEEKVVFLDTPGHAAFSAMRGQGAMATDIAVLVVALDDGVQPQTIEALKCAQNAKCAIVVALNKADKYPNATERSRVRSRVLAQLAQYDLLTEEYGGDVQVVEVAGKTGEGIDALVESLMVQAEIMELRACASGQAEAVVLDAHMEKGRGIVADVLVKWGALSIGDPVVVGCSFGRIKSMIDDNGKTIKKALPSQPVRLLGLRSIPNTGAELLSVDNEAKAKQIAERRIRLSELRQAREQSVVSEQSKVPELTADGEPIVKPVLPSIGVLIKADGLGSLDALKNIVSDISKCTDEVQIKILGESVGDVTLSDVERASAVGEALVLGFNVGIADNNTKMTAKQLDVTICKDEVIYRLEDELVQAVETLLPKDRIVSKEGTAKVLKVFKMKDRKSTVVAGLQVLDGKLKAGGSHHKYAYKIVRNGQVLLEENSGRADLKRFKDSVNEVESGNECGLSLEGFTEFQEGDEIECYQVTMQQRSLALNGYVSSRLSNAGGWTKGGAGADSAHHQKNKTAKSKV